jgi:molybdate transport system permease protein
VRRIFPSVLVVAATVALAFLLVPLVALFSRVSPATLAAQLRTSVFLDALVVSVETSLVAHALVLLVGTPTAYLLATRRFRGRNLVVGALDLPLVLPPAVAGIALFAAFGRTGLLGGALDALGMRVPLTRTAVVLAVAFVSSPFYVRGAIAAFESVELAIGALLVLVSVLVLVLVRLLPQWKRFTSISPIPFARSSSV